MLRATSSVGLSSADRSQSSSLKNALPLFFKIFIPVVLYIFWGGGGVSVELLCITMGGGGVESPCVTTEM